MPERTQRIGNKFLESSISRRTLLIVFSKTILGLGGAKLLTACGPGEWNNYYDPQHPGGADATPPSGSLEIGVGVSGDNDQELFDALGTSPQAPVLSDGQPADCGIQPDGSTIDYDPNDGVPCP